MATTTLADAVAEAPDGTHGVPTGDGTWRFAVQMLIASGGARVGRARVGEARVSQYHWWDLTADVAGIEWTRGTASGSVGLPRPNIGVLNMTLVNASKEYSPWATFAVSSGAVNTPNINMEYRPKALLRVVMFKPGCSTSTAARAPFTDITRTDWTPRFTGWVETWDVDTVLGRSVVKVRAVETMSMLAEIDKAAQAAQGADETLGQRLVRLNADAEWPFPLVSDVDASPGLTTTGGYSLQATTLDMNRLAEVYLSGDSVYATMIYSDTDGSMRVGEGAYPGYPNPGEVTFINAIVRLSSKDTEPAADAANMPNRVKGLYSGTLTISHNADFVINNCTTVRAGTTTPVYTYTSSESIGAYGKRSLKRSDLICFYDTMTYGYGFWLVSLFDGIGYSHASYQLPNTMQPGSVTIVDQQAAQRALRLLDKFIIDWYEPTNTTTIPDVRFVSWATQIKDSVVPIKGGIVWTTTISSLPQSVFVPSA